MRELRLTRTGRWDSAGCEILRLELRQDGKVVDATEEVVSGAPGRQTFRAFDQAVSGRSEPIPEGYYDDLGPLEWAGGEGDYSATWGPGLGPVWFDIYRPRALGGHLDANRSLAPGSAGCMALTTMAALQKVIGWWRAGKPQRLVVDWGLGTLGQDGRQVWKSFGHGDPQKVSVLHNGEPQPAAALRFDYHDGKAGFALGGKVIKPKSWTLQIDY